MKLLCFEMNTTGKKLYSKEQVEREFKLEETRPLVNHEMRCLVGKDMENTFYYIFFDDNPKLKSIYGGAYCG